MAITQDQLLTLIARQVGDVDAETLRPTTARTGLVASQLPLLWTLHADKDPLGVHAKILYVKDDAYELLINALRRKVDLDEQAHGVNARLHQEVQSLLEEQQLIKTKITTILEQRRSQRAPVAGMITATRPTYPPFGQAALPPSPLYTDANDQGITGSPYRAGAGTGLNVDTQVP
jgi:RNA-binding protein YhbY